MGGELLGEVGEEEGEGVVASHRLEPQDSQAVLMADSSLVVVQQGEHRELVEAVVQVGAYWDVLQILMIIAQMVDQVPKVLGILQTVPCLVT